MPNTIKCIPAKRETLDSQTSNAVSYFVNGKVPHHTEFSVPQTTTDYVLKQLKSMPYSKAMHPDGFSVSIFKIAAAATVAAITKVCNLSTETGKFPDQWTVAKVTSLFYLNGKREACSNY